MASRKRNVKKKTLSGQVRKVVSPAPSSESVESLREQDSLDDDVVPYVADFLREFSSLQPMPGISLLTPESAQAALTMLAQTQEKIQAQMRTAQALKKMLKSRSEEG